MHKGLTPFTIIALIILFAVFALAPQIVAQPDPATEAKIAPEVQAALADLPEGEMTTVIVTLVDQVDKKQFKGQKGPERQKAAVRALKDKASKSQKEIEKFLRKKQKQGEVEKYDSFWVLNGLSVTTSEGTIQELAARSDVLKITPDDINIVPTFAQPAPAAEANLALVQAPALWASGFYGQGIVVANMDSGVDLYHPDLLSRWRGGSNSWYDPYGEHPLTPTDFSGHGTWTMGTIVGGDAGGSAIGVAPQAEWIAVKIFSDSGSSTATAIHQGYQWLLDPDGDSNTADAPHIVNNSWTMAYPGCNLEFELDLSSLRAAGIVPVFAAGNFGPSAGTSASPANNPSALAVGEVNNGDLIMGSSSRGPANCGEATTVFPELVAPGNSIRTADLYGFYTNASGTSLAAPHVSGGLALLLSAFPDLQPSVQESALLTGVVDTGPIGPDNDFGNGRLDLLASFQWLDSNAAPPLGSVSGTNNVADAPSYESTVLADGPLHYYRLGEATGPAAVEQGTGASAATYGSTVTLPMAGLLANSSNTAAGFDGSATSYVDTGVTSLSGGPFSVEAWVNANAIGTAGHRIVAKDEIGAPGEWILWFNKGALRFQVRNTNSSWKTAQAPATPTSGTAFHVAAVFDGSDAILYLDGFEADRIALGTTMTNIDNTLPITIGADSDPTNPRGHVFDGTIDEVAFYNSALAGSQILAHFNAANAPGGMIMTDPTADFSGLAYLVGGTLNNVTDGSSCTIASFSATTLTCAAPLSGGTDNDWAIGDEYVATPIPPEATSIPPTATSIPPTATSIPPTATALPPTATPLPPTATPLPPTATPLPPTATSIPPTATALPPTATSVPPTATALPPTATPLPPAAPELLHFSTIGNVALPGVSGSNDDADVYLWDNALFNRFLDGSGEGLPGNADIDGLASNAGMWYLSFNRNGGTNIPGLGVVQDEDVVQYNPENEVWQLYFAGADACDLDASNGQDVDAIDVVGGVLYFSTIGNNSVGGVAGSNDDADIYAWDGTACSRMFDARGGAGNLLPGNADIDGLTVVDGDTFYLSFNRDGGTSITGFGTVQDESVVQYDAGVWSVYFDGTVQGLGTSKNQDLDAVDVQ